MDTWGGSREPLGLLRVNPPGTCRVRGPWIARARDPA
jgi:hypothetical protein